MLTVYLTLVFFIWCLIFEILYQLNKFQPQLNKGLKNLPEMSVEDFHEQVSYYKRKLVILDQYVIDVNKYVNLHPGGRFVLEGNYGRDITKFFNGAYVMSETSGAGYRTHSPNAWLVSNSLSIAVLKGQKELSDKLYICTS